MTVHDNLRTGADRRDLLGYITDLVRPATPRFAHEVSAAIQDFELADELDHVAKDLPYSRRRLLAVARAVATEPSITSPPDRSRPIGTRSQARNAAGDLPVSSCSPTWKAMPEISQP
jgi:hypothetical protein